MSQELLLTQNDQDQLRALFANVFDFFIDTFYHLPFDTSIVDTAEAEGVYCSILHNDELHNYDEVITTVSSAIGEDEETGMRVATAIDNKGRDIIFKGTKAKCVDVANKIKAIGLHVTVHLESFAKQQDKAYELMSYINDLVLSEEYNRPKVLQNVIEMIFCQELMKAWHTRLHDVNPDHRFVQLSTEYHPHPSVNPNSTQVPNEVQPPSQPSTHRHGTFASALGLGRFFRNQNADEDTDDEDDPTDINGDASITFKGHLKPTNYPLPSSVFDILPELNTVSFCHFRLDYIMHFHRKTWKSFRCLLMDMLLKSFCFTNVLSLVPDLTLPTPNRFNNISQFSLPIPINNRRDVFAIRYFELYPLILWDVLFNEREPYHTLNELGVQILTVPSIALFLESKYNASYLFGQLLLSTILFNQKAPFNTIIKSDHQSMSLPIIDVSKSGIRQSLYQKIIHDLLFFINTDDLKQCIRQRLFSNNPNNIVNTMIHILTLINGMNHQLQYTHSHISFESKLWRYAFNLDLNLNILINEIIPIINAENVHTIMKQIQNTLISYIPNINMGVQFHGLSLHCTLIRFLSPLILKYPKEWEHLEHTQMLHSEDPRLSKYLPLLTNTPNVSTVILSNLLAIQAYHHQLISLLWLRNGQIPFYEFQLLKLIRHMTTSMYLNDLQLIQYHVNKGGLKIVFDLYNVLMGGEINKYPQICKNDPMKTQLLCSNTLFFLLNIIIPLESTISNFLLHVFSIKSHLLSDLDDYFDHYNAHVVDIHSISTTKQSKQGILYASNHLKPINPYFYYFNKSNSEDVILDNKVNKVVYNAITSVPDVLLHSYLSIMDPTPYNIGMLLQLSLIGNNSVIMTKLVDLLNASTTTVIPYLTSLLQAASVQFKMDFSLKSLTSATSAPKDNKSYTNMLLKIKQQQQLAVTAYQDELDELDEVAPIKEENNKSTPYASLFAKQVFHAYNRVEDTCCICRESLNEGDDYGYLAFIAPNPFLINSNKLHLSISGCHLVHYRCTTMHILYKQMQVHEDRITSTDLSSNLHMTCPLCRCLSNCYLPVVGDGIYAHSMGTTAVIVEIEEQTEEETKKADIAIMGLRTPNPIHTQHILLIMTIMKRVYDTDIAVQSTLWELMGNCVLKELLLNRDKPVEYQLTESKQAFYQHLYNLIRAQGAKRVAYPNLTDSRGMVFIQDMPDIVDGPRVFNKTLVNWIQNKVDYLSINDKLRYLQCLRIYLNMVMGLTSIDLNYNSKTRQDALLKEWDMVYTEEIEFDVPRICPMPHQYETYFEMDLKCKRCNTVPEHPAMCLICGVITCFQVILTDLGTMLCNSVI